MTRIEVIRARDNAFKTKLDCDYTAKRLESAKKIWTMFYKAKQFKAVTIYQHETNKILFQIGNM